MQAVQEFLRPGVDARTIPAEFVARVDNHSQGLNNFSARFWGDEILRVSAE